MKVRVLGGGRKAVSTLSTARLAPGVRAKLLDVPRHDGVVAGECDPGDHPVDGSNSLAVRPELSLDVDGPSGASLSSAISSIRNTASRLTSSRA